MRAALCIPLLIGVAGLIASARGTVVTVQKVDDSSIRGDLISIHDGQIVVDTKAEKQPAQSILPTTMPLTDVSRIIFRPPPPQLTRRELANETPEDSQPSVIGGLIQAIFGGSGTDAAPTPNVQPAEPPRAPAPPARPTASINWLIQLSGGDLLHGHVSQWADQKLSLRLNAPLDQTVDVSTDRLRELWCGSDADRKKALTLGADLGPQDAAFVQKDDAVVKVDGLVLGIAGDFLRFQYGGAERKIALSRLVGIVIGSAQRGAPAESFRQSVQLDSQDVLSGTLTGMDTRSVVLTTPSGAILHLPTANIYSIDFLNGRLVYLSDLAPAKVTQTAFFGRVIPYRVDAALDGGPLQLSDGNYAKGIAMHSRCILEYNIHDDFQRFRARVGFEQPGGKLGRADLRVLGDAAILYENPDARGDGTPVDIDADMTGHQTLTLEVDFGKDQDVGDRVIWANARLLKAK